MSLTGRTIAHNTLFYSGALTVQKLLSFFYFTYLARSVGSTVTGKYFFALSVGGIVAGIIDVGLTPVLIREAAKDTNDASRLTSTMVTLKLCIVAVLAVLAYLSLPALFPDVVIRKLVVISLMVAVFDSFALTFFAAIRAHQNLIYESFSAILFYCIVIVLGGLAIFRGYDIRIVILALLAASTWNMLFAYVMLVSRIGVPVRLIWDSVFVRSIAKAALPFFIAAAFIKVYAYLDTVMLKYIAGDTAVGWYSVPYKITFAFQFIPMALIAALYPAFSYYAQHDRARLSMTLTRSFTYLLVISFAIAGGIGALAPGLIPALYTAEYQRSVAPLIILIASLPFLFLNFPIGSLLNACNRQTRQTVHLGVTMVFNALLNVYMIPRYGVIGAAVASSLSTFFVFCLGIYVIAKQLVVFDVRGFASLFLRLLMVTAAMVATALALQQRVPWYGAIMPGAVVYLAGLYILRVITREDLLNFRSLFRR